jgi:nitroreductase
MNDMLALLARRRSVPPKFMAAPAPSEAELGQLLTIAARVPDHGKLTPWRFVTIGPHTQRRFAEALAEFTRADNPDATEDMLQRERERFASPLVVAVISTAAPHPKIPEWEQELSAGAVCMNLVTAATAMGYGASWLTGWQSYDPRFLALLGVKAGERVAGLIHIGSPKEVPADRPRPALADIVTHLD